MDTPQFPGFEIMETLPRGGMSTVYKARQISLDRIVALKSLPLALAAESADITQFLDEARITANLKHPNIVQVYDFGKTKEGIYYFVMEFVSGYSVGDWIRRKQFLTEQNALLVARSVAEALSYAWKTAAIIHCDIKPDNLIIDGDGTVKVADLGLAKSVQSVVDRAKLSGGIVFGTPNYISPEQSRGDADLDCRADIYSLGATLYHCMTGKMPFERAPAVTVMDLQISDKIPDAQEVNPRISVEAACLLETMLVKDRQHRQADWDAVLVDVSRVMNHQMPGSALPAPNASTMQRSPSRGAKPRIKVAVSTPIPILVDDTSADSTAFRNMERQFALKQKRKPGVKLEGWVAAILTLAVLVLGVLVARSLWLQERPSVLEGKKFPPPVSPEPASQDVSEVSSQPADAKAREDNAREMFEFARKWTEANPSLINEAIRQYEKVAHETRDTSYSLKAAEEIQKLQEAKQKALNAVMETLNSRAIPLVAKKKFAQAVNLYEQYEGEWAAETAERRDAKIRELGEQDRVFQERRQRAAEEVDRQWHQGLDRICARLVEGDTAGALAQLQQAAEAPPMASRKNEIRDLQLLLAEVSRMDQRILDAFRSLKGQSVTVVLTYGVEQVTIRDVQNDIIQAEKIVTVSAGHISQPKSFQIADLALSEKRLRLGSDDKPEVALMQGLLSLQEQDWVSAESFFANTGPVLAPRLITQLNELKHNQGEKQARRALLALLRNVQIDMSKGSVDCDDCLAAIQKKNFSLKEAQGLAKAVETYRAKFGQTRVAQDYEPALKALAHVSVIERETSSPSVLSPQTPPGKTPASVATQGRPGGAPFFEKPTAARSTPDAVKAQLLERNPGMEEETIVFQRNAFEKIVRVEIISQAIKDIRPLSVLPDLRELVCCGMPPTEREWQRTLPTIAPLADLTFLKGLPLCELDISHTMVRDISPLMGMPLNRLSLAHTRVVDMGVLKGMPLTVLDIKETRIRDIGGLREMPLQRLNLSDTDVADLTVLKGMPLERLDMARSKIRDLTPLSGLPLVALDLSGTEIKDYSVIKDLPLNELSLMGVKGSDFDFLSGLKLASLELSESDIRDFSVLKGMPLNYLGASGTRIRDKDLIVLQELPLQALSLNDTKIKDLTPLKNIKSLKSLGIRRTQVKDITPLQDLPIERISLDYNPYQPGEKHWFTAVLRRMPRLRMVNGQPWGGGGGWRRKR